MKKVISENSKETNDAVCKAKENLAAENGVKKNIGDNKEKPDYKHIFMSVGMVLCSFLLAVFVISILPHYFISAASEVFVGGEFPSVTETTLTVPAELISSTETTVPETAVEETVTVDKSKTKVDKSVKADVASGNAAADEDPEADKAKDSSTSGAQEVDVNKTASDAQTSQLDSEVTNLKYVSAESLTGLQTIDSKLYYFNDNHEFQTGYQQVGNMWYYFNDYGACASKVGIDVSYAQGKIDWPSVKASGVDYAIIRVGFRGWGSEGKLRIDKCFSQNIQSASAAGVKTGLYFFSQATNVDEAIAEASAAVNALRESGCSIQYPIYYDTEYSGASGRSGRADRISKSVRTACAVAFCETVKSAGYKAGVYASAAFYDDELYYSQLAGYNIWVAHYTKGSVTDFRHGYKMWQYSDEGRISGIYNNVDIDIGLYDYAESSDMSKLGSDVIVVANASQLVPFSEAESAIKTYQTEKTEEAYNAALGKIDSLANERVKSALSNKLKQTKESISQS